MDTNTLLFFDGHLDALPLFEALAQRICAEIDGVSVQAKKSQISFFNRHMFACVSFLRVRKKTDLPSPYLVLTFGLGRRVLSPQIARTAEPYPGRWTHHVVLATPAEIDDTLMAWLHEAAAFSASKR